MSCAAVICYSRPFIGRRQYPAIPSRYSKFSDELFETVHALIVDQRNRFQAHRDEDFNLVRLLPKGAEVSWGGGSQKGKTATHGEIVSARSLKLEVFPIFARLCDLQIEQLRQRISEEKDRLFP
jgi:hypothetical protein